MKNIAQRLTTVQQQIRTAEEKFDREAGSVNLLAVSKTWPAADILAAAKQGQRDFGENYLQEALEKIDTLRDQGLVWHYIGHIQSNKTRPIAEHFDWVHSVDRPRIAHRLSEARPAHLPPLNICIQINISAETTKSGIQLPELMDLAHEITTLPGLKLRGLMAIPAPVDDFSQQRAAFHLLKTALSHLQKAGIPVDTLSMGTSNDMEAAIAEGSTIVRIGTAIFGERG